MITISLLHPTQSVSIQHWSFESESLVRIGRASDNDVVIYSAVVSRHHVELWQDDSSWIIINFGANGTYVNNEPIIQVSVVDKMMIRLGNSGPKLKIVMEEVASNFLEKNQNLSHKELTLIPESNLPKIKGKDSSNSQDMTRTEFD
ncbi:MAG: FHA domain-containing protein [Microcoleaceae cyanobacterium]